MQLLWASAQFLVSDISPIYLVDEFVSLLQVLPKEIRMLVESKILYFLFLVVGLSSEFSCVNLEWKASPLKFLEQGGIYLMCVESL